MFDRLLFEEDSNIGPELDERFADASKAYLQITERISEGCHSRLPLED